MAVRAMSAHGQSQRPARNLAPVHELPAVAEPQESAVSLAERAFVGCLFWLSVAEGAAATTAVADTDLGDPQLRGVLAACRSLLASGRRADPALVAPKMVRAGLPATLAGRINGLVAELITEPLVPECWRVYAQEVLAGAAARRVDVAAVRLRQVAGECLEVVALRDFVAAETSALLDDLARLDGALR
jgi:hypothetical protein